MVRKGEGGRGKVAGWTTEFVDYFFKVQVSLSTYIHTCTTAYMIKDVSVPSCTIQPTELNLTQLNSIQKLRQKPLSGLASRLDKEEGAQWYPQNQKGELPQL